LDIPTGLVGLLAGATLASFCVTLAFRHAEGVDGFWGRSRCDACGLTLRLADTAPLLSYLRGGGRCHACQSAIWPGHPLGEAAGAAAGLAAGLLAPPATWPALALGLGASLYGAAYDARTQRIPDAVSALVLAAGLAAAALDHALPEVVLTAALLGALAFTGVVLFRRLAGRSGLGLGDVKLIAALSVWTGASLSPLAVAAAACLALAWLAMRGELRHGTRVAFAPFLCLGFWPLALGRIAA
jgi:leader peptidase (prepilin peptidase)/N-methyltransferase